MDIFIKKKDLDKYEKLKIDTLDYKEIISTIPEDAISTPNKKFLEMGRKEWRWRILNFSDDDKKIEISYYDSKDKKRHYLNNSGKWVLKDIPSTYDSLVTEVKYYYPEN